MAKILILGGGFSGMIAAEKLSLALAANHEITLVSNTRNFVFYPGLIRLALGDCEIDDISFDLEPKLKIFRTRFVQGEVIGLDLHKRKVRVIGDDINGEIGYDFLIFALGRRLATEKINGFFDYSEHLLDAKSAYKFGESVRNFKRGNIVIGLCPDGKLPVPVCETAFALSNFLEKQEDELISNISVVFPESVEKAFGGAHISEQIKTTFEKHNIELITDFEISKITKNELQTADGRVLYHDLLMLIPPFRGHSFLQDLPIADEKGFIKVDGFMRVHGAERVYAAGDAVAFSGPKLGHMAVRQGHVAADNVIAEVLGKPVTHEYYHEISTVIDAGGSDSIYLHYGIWDDFEYSVQQNIFWSWAKHIHDKFWKAFHS